MKIALPDLISNSYFPAVAAVELGFFKQEGLDLDLELIFPVDKSYRALRDGAVDFVAGSGHSVAAAFPEWRGARFLGALSQGMYWFLVMRADLRAARGDIGVVKGKRIGAAPMVELGLKRLLVEAGIDLARDAVTIAPVPGSDNPGVNFGVNAAKALEDGKIDGFWANGMGTEVAVRRGVGTVVLDARRGDGPKAAYHYTMAALVTTERLVERAPDQAEAAVRALVRTQRALKQDVTLATQAARNVFPAHETGLIADIVARDLPYYDATISAETFNRMHAFALDMGLVTQPASYEQVVATQFRHLWTG